MSPPDATRTTITLEESTKEKFDRAKPYQSLSADEFVEQLIEDRQLVEQLLAQREDRL